MKELGMFWWAFAVRGGGAILFAGFLLYSGSFFGTIFFDPIMFVVLALVLGFYILSNGILLGVASGYAAEHQVDIWQFLLAECIFDTALGTYVGLTLLLSSESLAWLAGLHALGTGCFLAALAWKLRANKAYSGLLGVAGFIAFCAGLAFVLYRQAATRTATHWLGGFELFYGVVVFVFAEGLHRHHVPLLRGESAEFR
ncbi:hypothetical protein AciX9_4415 (plasmid) [Granulicella tundricola MP5ACTX9]|uniref:Uncharacterized protein n=2 Tax=Granulicella TaxID=940557 RepID=E8X7D1_GRATM|nr:hypothetical protein AciX9_4415 [Granulicella tundricola MP5ACTX9]